jgi:NADH-quinone oxidoreductase subunit F
MRQLTSIDEFVGFRSRVASAKKIKAETPTLVVSGGTCGQASGANDIMRIVKRCILEQDLGDRISLRITGCHGFCQVEPFILVEPGQHLYPRLKMEDVPRVIDAALGGVVEPELIYTEPFIGAKFDRQDEIPFFKKQTRTILGSNQKLDPIRIFNYVERDGYSALEKVLTKNDPNWIIEEIKTSGIRGRGGAGFPTGKKWEFARASGQPGQPKYVVCNCDEGDPGAYMDRSLLEGNPHSILEGMIIAGIAIGATQGIIYVRGEYPLAIKHTMIALRQARELGLLGDDILGTGIDFDIEIVRGAGAFVCGEETALIRSVEGFMGEPRQRPPFPITRGIDGFPTCINNVETLANIRIIINCGGAEYAKVGTPGNTGTKIFSLVGKIRNTGLVEVPLGMTIGEVVHDIGGGPPGKAKIKAVQTGGPSGGCIPAARFDLPLDYDSLKEAGSIMGSGGMIVMDEDTCMVDVAKYFMAFLKDESCGKCYTCRKGTQRMYEILEDITEGRGTLDHLSLLEELAVVVKDTSMCGLGQSAANPVLSTLRYFRHEYERHIVDKRCDAFVCKDLVGPPCQSACPVGTEAWRYVANIGRGEFEEAYRVIREANPFPSVCARACDHQCEERCRAGTSGGDPIAIRALKRFVTDRIDPSSYQPVREEWTDGEPPRIAVIGAGPAGLTAAHCLSLKGYRVSIFEAEPEPGGMLYCAIPEYRLPREVIRKEIESLLDENIEVICNTRLGADFTIDSLLGEGFSAVLLALGAHKSRPLGLDKEDAPGVYPSIEFLKAFNQRGEQLAKGRVGVIGGGNSAIDAARTALRQRDVESVAILYRRTRAEMPAFEEEIEAAIQEGITIETLVSPTEIRTTSGIFSHLVCARNSLGAPDSSGRRRPVLIPNSEHLLEFDTLIVAISEDSGVDCISPARAGGIEVTDWNTVKTDSKTLLTSRTGVFAAGDVITGPNTIIDAVADGKKAAAMIDLHLKGEELVRPARSIQTLPYIDPPEEIDESVSRDERVETPRASVDWRKRNFAEVEVGLSIAEAHCEASRCLRCDLEFAERASSETRADGGSTD